MQAVFISYSRRDNGFVERLHDALRTREYDVWVDVEGIAPGSTWFEEIRSGIEGADGFIYVISPDSLASQICRWELEYAVTLRKRIVPVVRRDPGSAAVPEALVSRSWLLMREFDDFGGGVEQLLSAIETDLDHVRTGASVRRRRRPK